MMSMLRYFLSGEWCLDGSINWSKVFKTKEEHGEYNSQFVQRALFLSVGFLLFRFLCYRFIFQPLGSYVGITKQKRIKPIQNDILEKAYRKKNTISHTQVQEFSKKLMWNERQVQRWWRDRRKYDQSTSLSKFQEQCYFFLMYSVSFVYGCYLMCSIPWLTDIKYGFSDFPRKPIPAFTNYLLLTLSFNFTNFLYYFWATKRKEFWSMIIHHFVSTSLIYFGFLSFIHSVSIFVNILHDVADVFLTFTKIMRYCKCEKILPVSYALFVFVWIASRAVLYPMFFLSADMMHGVLEVIPFSQSIRRFVVVDLYVLYILHLYWTYLVLRLTYNFIKGWNVTEDIRSFSENSSDSEDKKEV